MRTRTLLAAVLLGALLTTAGTAAAGPADGRTELRWSAAEPGPPPVLGLAPGRVLTVSFLDGSGGAWPVSELVAPEVPWLTVRRAAEHPHVAIVRTASDATARDGVPVNLVALLAGLSAPVHLTLGPGAVEAPTAVTVRITESRGAGAAIAGAETPRGADLDEAIRGYLLANPDVLREALDPRRQLAARVSERREELLGAAGVPVLGDAAGAVTVVEFFDYRCGYCKRSLDAVRSALLLAGVRLQMREYPILGEESDLAARAALAAARQEAYGAMHFALMAHEGEYDLPALVRIAQDLGLDVDRLRADMDSPQVAALIEANRELASRLGVTGTPAFLVVGPGGVEVSPGAVDADRLAAMVDAAG